MSSGTTAEPIQPDAPVPNARGRLEQAAIELYIERGYEQTTVAEIAKRAGLTERTFFRHFADKREVLFWGSGTPSPARRTPRRRSTRSPEPSRASASCSRGAARAPGSGRASSRPPPNS